MHSSKVNTLITRLSLTYTEAYPSYNFLQQADWDTNPSLAISSSPTDISLILSDSLYMSVSIYVPEGGRKDEM